MLLGSYYDGIEIHREQKIVYGRFLVPHRVISTCPAAGNREDLEYLYNHQSCEPTGHDPAALRLVAVDPKGYRSLVCRQYGVAPRGAARVSARQPTCATPSRRRRASGILPWWRSARGAWRRTRGTREMRHRSMNVMDCTKRSRRRSRCFKVPSTRCSSSAAS